MIPSLAMAGEPAGTETERQTDALPRVSLREAVSQALARHPQMALARADLERAEALLRQARAASLPTLSSTLTYSRLDDDRILGEGTPAERTVAGANAFSGNISLSVPLVHASRWMQWRYARDNVRPAQASADDARRLVAAAAARAYLGVLAQRRALAVALRARDTARHHVAFAQKKFDGGTGNRLDLIRAQTEEAGAEAALQSSRWGLGRAHEALGVVLGRDGPVDAAGDEGLPEAPEAAEAQRTLPSYRADLRALAYKAEAARRLLGAAFADFLPYLTGVFQPFVQEPATLTQPQLGWQAQIILTLPLYDGGLRYGQHAERRALLASAEAALAAALRQARADLRAAVVGIRHADLALQAARDAARLGTLALTLATQAYEAGATTNLEVIDAARKAHDAQSAAVAAEDAARQARLELLIAAGRFP